MAKRLDGAYGRNERCPCGSGKKIKKCCTHLLRSVDTSDVKANEYRNNGEASQYVRTADALKDLPPPSEESKFKAQMTCGCCRGSGKRKKYSIDIPGNGTPNEMVECDACVGEGWYWVNVSHPTPIEDNDEEPEDAEEQKEEDTAVVAG